MSGWVWILLTVSILLAVGWYFDHKRRRVRDLETGKRGGRTPAEARRHASLGLLYRRDGE
ncbi:MAG TPA: hypothetical protein VFM37_12775 [Pseudonocardiaceae bacterium]|nr:hypothetical protein [Pseudonocardiaceae bacterium]